MSTGNAALAYFENFREKDGAIVTLIFLSSACSIRGVLVLIRNVVFGKKQLSLNFG